MPEHPRVVVVAGARPNFMKVAPVMEALVPEVEVELVHSGQRDVAGCPHRPTAIWTSYPSCPEQG